MPGFGGVSTGGGGGGGTNSTSTEPRNDACASVDTDTELDTILDTIGATKTVIVPGPWCPMLVLPAGWGGNVRCTGMDRSGAELIVTLTGTASTTQKSTSVFIGSVLFEVLTPGGGGAHTASIRAAPRVCTATAPVASIDQVSEELNRTLFTMGTKNLTNGWVDVTPSPDTLGKVRIHYTVSHTHTIT